MIERYSKVVVDIRGELLEFNLAIADMYPEEGERRHLVVESISQIFERMDSDFTFYRQCIVPGPEFKRLPGSERFATDPIRINLLADAWKTFATGIWFALYRVPGLLSPALTLVIAELNSYFMTVDIHKEL